MIVRSGTRIRAIQEFVGSAIDSLAPLVESMDKDGKIWLEDESKEGRRPVVIPEEFHSRASAIGGTVTACTAIPRGCHKRHRMSHFVACVGTPPVMRWLQENSAKEFAKRFDAM